MRLAILGAGALLLLAACGSGATGDSGGPHTHTPTKAERAAILRATDTAFFTSTGAPPDLRLTGLVLVTDGLTAWARDTFGPAPKAPATTEQGLAGGHDRGLLRQTGSGGWAWLGYVPAGSSCRTAGRSAPLAVARLLGLPPACAQTPAPNATPSGPAITGVTVATLSTGDLATLLSIFVSAKNSGPTGQVVTPTTIVVSTEAPPLAAKVNGDGEWAMVTYVPADGAPEPLTGMQLQDGAGTAFFSKPRGGEWVLRGLAGAPFCTGAANAHVPPAILTLWDHSC